MAGNHNITPVMLRPCTTRAFGTTAFFRNRPLYDVLLNQLKVQGKAHYTLLFHACSIGAEVYSFVVHYLLRRYDKHFSIEVYAIDLEPGFVHYARIGEYPPDILDGMSTDERSFFVTSGDAVSAVPEVRQMIEYLDACSYIDFESRKNYEVVFLLNTLCYVPNAAQSLAIDKVAGYNSDFLITSAFHMDTIKEDLTRNRYRPVLDQQIAIHDAWTDKRVAAHPDDFVPGNYTNWHLPEFSEIEDYEYKYCAIFRK